MHQRGHACTDPTKVEQCRPCGAGQRVGRKGMPNIPPLSREPHIVASHPPCWRECLYIGIMLPLSPPRPHLCFKPLDNVSDQRPLHAIRLELHRTGGKQRRLGSRFGIKSQMAGGTNSSPGMSSVGPQEGAP